MNTIAALLLCLFGTMPGVSGEVVDSVDALEVNYVYDDKGRECLRQLIGWESSTATSGFSVVFWRRISADNYGMLPQFNQATQTYTSQWHDGDTLRVVKARKRWERHLQYDVEIVDRDYRHESQRRGLTPHDQHYRSTGKPQASDLEFPLGPQ